MSGVKRPAAPAKEDAVDTLARTIWGEARGEGPKGMLAVGLVVRNRTAAPGWWGHDTISVCRAPWQFSCWNVSDPNHALLLKVSGADPAFTTALTIADRLLNHSVPDITLGANSYYAVGSPRPVWANGARFTTQIGRHLFYSVPGPGELAWTPGNISASSASGVTAEELNREELEELEGGQDGNSDEHNDGGGE